MSIELEVISISKVKAKEATEDKEACEEYIKVVLEIPAENVVGTSNLVVIKMPAISNVSIGASKTLYV